ncbi:VgrG-related protein [Ruania zhangjianzhongii]|uniref:VgrG-related protein n=1 Tax=Ruania zhangjianzhongii TaxID=2603206 RepID=UPI0011C76F38|nr:VgrG-related protein [Ruania zhangjianzhongii]
MPTDEVYFYRPVVKVAGAVLPEQWAALITEVYVDDSVHLPGLLVLRFSDPEDAVLEGAGLAIGKPVSLAVGSSTPGTPEPLIEATVTSLEREIDSRGMTTVVRALDARRKLQGGAKMATYVDQKISDIVNAIAGSVGVACQVDQIGPVYPQLTQDAVSDWEFVTRLATAHGAVLSMKGKTLELRMPPTASSAPTATGDPLVLEVGKQVLGLRSTITDSDQVPEVEARGWSPKEKRFIAHSAKADSTSASVTSTPKALATGRAAEVISVPGQSEIKAVQARAESRMSSRAGGFAELEARVRGNAKLFAGAAITLKGAGKKFDGKYVLSAARHRFDEIAGYVTDVTVAHAADRSTYGVLTGAIEAPPATRGMLPALVTNLKDPDNQGRVKVKLPTLSDTEESWWARVVQAGAGAQRGTVLLPEVGDEVLVAFGGTGVESPYVLGGVYNGKDLPLPAFDKHVDGTGKVIRRGFTSRTGMSVEVLEDASGTKLNVRNKDSKERITIIQAPNGGIEIVSQGTISITAQQDIKLAGQIVEIAAKGDLKLSGVNVKIAAKANADLEAQANASVKANGNTSLEGTVAAVKGKASAELSASGPVTVRGALVNIN